MIIDEKNLELMVAGAVALARENELVVIPLLAAALREENHLNIQNLLVKIARTKEKSA